MLSLVADYSNSSSSSTDSDELEKEVARPAKTATAGRDEKPRLPSADLLLATSSSKKAGEVFCNPYLEAENAKTAVLEKHVKMVNKDQHLKQINGRKICWNYRKGRCRFGSNCHYAHDSDLTVANEVAKKHKTAATEASTSQMPLDDTNEGEPRPEPVKKRKRPGLSDSIEPAKRVMKNYMQQQAQKTKRKS